jgi:hypothetical protein
MLNKNFLDYKIVEYTNLDSDCINIINKIENESIDGNVWQVISQNNRQKNNAIDFGKLLAIDNFALPSVNLQTLSGNKYLLKNNLDKASYKAIIDYINDERINMSISNIWTSGDEPGEINSIGWNILKYDKEDVLKTDSFYFSSKRDGLPLLTIIFFINDDYEGGEILFKDRLGNIPYKPKANSMLIFPATDQYQYKVLPVTSGIKYSAITFAD